MRRLLSFCLCALLAVGSPASVFAQGDEAEKEQSDYKSTVAEATKAYERGEYDKAIELFEKAYALKPVSNILYNIGRIHEDAGDIDGAIEYYDKFVVAPNVEKNARKDALERLQTLREVKAIQDGQNTEVAETTETGTETTPDPAPEPQPEPKPAPSAGKTLGWVFVGAGAVSLAGAGVFALLTQSQFGQFEDATTLDARRDAASTGATYAVVADSLLAVGVVSGIVGVIFLATSGNSETAGAAKIQIAPTVSKAGAGIGFGMKF